MENVDYWVAIETYMEVLDYLIMNNLFIFDSGYNFLDSRIRISEQGFIKETQTKRGNWNEETIVTEFVTVNEVLKHLTDIISDILRYEKVPSSVDENYAYVHDTEAIVGDIRLYFPTYQDIASIIKSLEVLKEAKTKQIPIGLIKHKNIINKIKKLNNVQKELIYLYSELESTLLDYTAGMLFLDEFGNPIESDSVDKYTLVNWEEFCLTVLANCDYFENKEKNNGKDLTRVLKIKLLNEEEVKKENNN